MIKIMIVDDEKIVRDGLRTTINWHELGFTIVGEAKNGKEALEKFPELLPDIIITDIAMPYIDGLELITAINRCEHKAEFVILTGYEDFGYAKKAMQYGVTSYLLKPIDNDELTAALKKIDSKIKNKKYIDEVSKSYISLKKSNLLADLLETNLKYSSLSGSEKYNFMLPKDKYFIASLALNCTQEEYDSDLMFMKLWKETEYASSMSGHYILTHRMQKNIVAMIFINDKYTFEKAITMLNSIIDKFTDGIVTIGLSGIFRTPDIVQRAYIQSQRALEQRAVLKNRRIIDYTEISFSNDSVPVLSAKQTAEIIEAVQNADINTASSIINDYFKLIYASNKTSTDVIKSSALELSISLIKAMIPDTDMMEIVFGKQLRPALELQQLNTISEIKEWLLSFISNLTSAPEAYSLSGFSEPVQRAILYIMSNYRQSISSKKIADMLFVSPRYISKHFKEETGKTITEYHAEYRIKKAVELIKNKNVKIYEICDMVGYKDAKHFYQTFKKITGMSPKAHMASINSKQKGNNSK